MSTNFVLGDRVCLDSHFATIRYLGGIDGTGDDIAWIGLEWDDPARGKHDGSHKGKTYFVTSTPKGGSFVKANKVEAGIGLVEAVKERYGSVEGQVQVNERDIKDLQRTMNAPFLEMVGFEKINKIQNNFRALRVIGLKNMRVKGLSENLRDLAEWIPNVQDLDLDDNLLTSWDALADIGRQLPRLRALNVSGNRMSAPTDPAAHAKAFSGLSHLILGRMNLAWEDVLRLTRDLKALKELQCYDNAITEVGDLPEGVFRDLDNLDINSNDFKDWKYVSKFSKLPNLKILNLNACGLVTIEAPSKSESETYFPALKSIQLSFNEINDWQSVTNLMHIKLNEVRIRTNPILETEQGNFLAIVVQFFVLYTCTHILLFP